MDTTTILQLNETARAQGLAHQRKRFAFKKILDETGRHQIGLVGPRGSGKTVILKQLLAHYPDSACYLTLDAVDSPGLFQTIQNLHEKYKFTLFLVDEIHHEKQYARELKKVYDFLDVRVIFSSSVALSLHETAYDLSRRVNLVFINPFSFREYLYFTKELDLSALSVNQLLEQQWDALHLRQEIHFENFLKGGLFPFALEEPNILPLLGNILDKIITSDIPLIGRLLTDEIPILHRMMRFIGFAPPDGINYSSLSNNLKITKYKAEQYVRLLEQAFVLKCVMPAGTNVMKEPKILMRLPYRLLFQPYEHAIGAIREEFFAEMMICKGISFNYLKSTRGAKTPDYLVHVDTETYVIEIGGPGKGREQFKGFAGKKNLILAHSNETTGIKRPLFLIGF
ncbi:MAG: ATP-binding protein [Deltaproteobacteria bacterium]|nr:ATP-binding protein [Deltaproteobacteria bacterium]